MKRIWKCDFCHYTNMLSENVKKHEDNCSSNPIFKKCWSCEYHTLSFDYDDHDCSKGIIPCWDYEDNGNCPTWKPNIKDIKLLRKLKLDKLMSNE